MGFNQRKIKGNETELSVWKRYGYEYQLISQDNEDYPVPYELTQIKDYKKHKTPDFYFKVCDTYFDVKSSLNLIKRNDIQWYYNMGLYSNKPVYIITRGKNGWEVLDVMHLQDNILTDVEWIPKTTGDDGINSEHIWLKDYPFISELLNPFESLFT